MKRHRLVIVLLLLAIIGLQVVVAQQPDPIPLAQNGPYFVGRQALSIIDSTRDDRELAVQIWYPALMPEGLTQVQIDRAAERGHPNAVPDASGAAYPVVIYSHGTGGNINEASVHLTLLASYGIVGVSVEHHSRPWLVHIDRPLDITAVLEQLPAVEDVPVIELIDFDNLGMMGFSIGAMATLQMIGLMTDVDHYESWCADDSHDVHECDVHVEELTEYQDALGLLNEDGSWHVFGDERIKAVLPISSCFYPLVSEDSLAQVTLPIMIMYGVTDQWCNYEANAARAYTYLGSSEKYLISVVPGAQRLPFSGTARMHLMVAFWGYYLQGEESYAQYLTADFVNSFDDLVWGVYKEE